MTSNILTQEELKQLLDYDPITGNFIWKVTRGKSFPGKKAGNLHISKSYKPECKYWEIGVKGRKYLAHRLVWLYMTGEWPKRFIDHKDRDTLNNKWDNLREATTSENNQNSVGKIGRKLPKWVYYHGSNYKAQIKINGKSINLGSFSTPEEAHEFAAMKAKELHGEYYRPDGVQ